MWVGVIALAVAALVAAALARRFTRPLTAAVATTRRIASGDLDATVPVGPREDPEFAQLAESINAMGANLVRARDQERQFLLSVSHELRTPLTSIRGYADAVLDGTADDAGRGRRRHQLPRPAGWSGWSRTCSTWPAWTPTASRWTSETSTPPPWPPRWRRASGPGPRSSASSSPRRPRTDRPLWVVADPDRLAQVVANLVENASSFARRVVTVGAGNVGDTPDHLGGWTTDPASRPTSSPRSSSATSRRTGSGGRRKGSGLGLAIVSELSGAMGAGVRAESPVTSDGGTRMLVWFRPVSPPTDPETPGASRPTGTDVDGAGGSVAPADPALRSGPMPVGATPVGPPPATGDGMGVPVPPAGPDPHRGGATGA